QRVGAASDDRVLLEAADLGNDRASRGVRRITDVETVSRHGCGRAGGRTNWRDGCWDNTAANHLTERVFDEGVAAKFLILNDEGIRAGEQIDIARIGRAACAMPLVNEQRAVDEDADAVVSTDGDVVVA